jgi:hypothetical protein
MSEVGDGPVGPVVLWLLVLIEDLEDLALLVVRLVLWLLVLIEDLEDLALLVVRLVLWLLEALALLWVLVVLFFQEFLLSPWIQEALWVQEAPLNLVLPSVLEDLCTFSRAVNFDNLWHSKFLHL